MNIIAYFEIQSSNPQREIEFYKTVFDWNFVKEEFLPIEYYRIETKGILGELFSKCTTGYNHFIDCEQLLFPAFPNLPMS